jgi:hypothetical protein
MPPRAHPLSPRWGGKAWRTTFTLNDRLGCQTARSSNAQV